VQVKDSKEKAKLLKFGGFMEKEFKERGNEALREELPFSEPGVLGCFESVIEREFPCGLEVFSFKCR
jgi:hypothetical protein